ncbi:ferredoxin [Methanofollis sp. W23]|uniref:ferredoxin n=1 Tax=Methanofollis sp. W23 TaxID=2817849 RepID=UPI001AE6EB07|nr:ferredoxin [Methanofollis sp. W23]MBP2145792.1 ferredoxin [Methanofollis sp. W23]
MVLVTIEREECTSCALCWETCPEIFEESPDGRVQIREEYQTDGPDTGEIPDEIEDCAGDAADGCPVEIIEVGG